MTKYWFLIITAYLYTSIVQADVQCTGQAQFQSVFADFSCQAGRCSGYIPSQNIKLEGSCESEVIYAAEGQVTSSYLSGSCVDGVLTLSSNPQKIYLYGNCSLDSIDYGTFSSFVYSPTADATGFCQSNGTSRLYFEGASRSFKGVCHQ